MLRCITACISARRRTVRFRLYKNNYKGTGRRIMLKNQIFVFLLLIACIVYSKPVKVLVYSAPFEHVYESSMDSVIAKNLNKNENISATPFHDDNSVLAEDKLSKYDALFLVHADYIGEENEKNVVSMVESGKLGLVTSHITLRYNEEIRNLIGMTTMYTDYIDTQTVWTALPDHPIAAGVQDTFVLKPGQPYVTFTVSSDVSMIFKGESTKDKDLKIGWAREPGQGRTFNFCPEHETFPHYNEPNVQKIFQNAAIWVANTESNIQLFRTKQRSISHSKVSITPMLHSGPWSFYISIQKDMNSSSSGILYNAMGRTVNPDITYEIKNVRPDF